MHYFATDSLLKIRTKGVAALAVIIVGLICFSNITHAKQKDSDDGWGEWTPLSDAFVARRREAININLPEEDRRHANVQARLDKLTQQRDRLLAKVESLDESKNKKARKLLKRIAKLNQKILKQSEKNLTLITAADSKAIKTSTLWMHTGEQGLYTVSISELTTKFGISEKQIRKKAQKGKLNITSAADVSSQLADQTVSWHYDEDSDSILYPAKARITFHTDENAFKFKLNGKKAAPMVVVNGDAPAIGSATPFSELLTYEEEPDLKYVTWAVAAEPDADYWFWDSITSAWESRDYLEVNLFVPEPADLGTARIRITLRGSTEVYEGIDEHHVSAYMGDAKILLGSVSWDGFNEAVLDLEFDQSILEQGNNTLRLENDIASFPLAQQRLDKIELEYQRNPVALNNKLWMHDVSFGSQLVSGFTSDDILVVESPDESAKLRNDILIMPDGNEGWNVLFDAVGGTDYLITERGAFDVASVTIDANAKLRKKNNRADYLIIAPRVFEQTAELLADYRSSRYSEIKIVWLEDIYNEFSAGRVDPFAISRFMQRAVNKWNRSPSTVVLLGKGTLDLKNRMGFSDNFIPMIFTSTPWSLASSDGRLLGYEDNTPFAYGRIPMTNNTQGMAYVEKLRAHEQRVPGPELFTAVLAADNPDEAGDFHANTNALATKLQNSLGFNSVLTLLHPSDEVRHNLIDSNTWETEYVSYDGHGATFQLGNGSENFLVAFPHDDNDVTRLTNNMYPIFTALTCVVGDDVHPGYPSLVTTLVMNPSGGAIASVAPSGLSLDHDAQILGSALVDSLFIVNSRLGDALNSAKNQTKDELFDFMPRIYSVVGEPDIYAR